MPNGTYGGVRGRKTIVGRKLLRFPPTRLLIDAYSHMIVGWAAGPALEIVYLELERIILFYNTERPHMSIGMPAMTLQRHTRSASARLSIPAMYFLESYVYT